MEDNEEGHHTVRPTLSTLPVRGEKSADKPSPSSPYPPKAKPVSLRRNPHVAGACENKDWLPFLCDGTGNRCTGPHPLTIPTEVLTRSGHPPRRTRDLVNAFAKGAGGDCLYLDGINEYADIRRRACVTCVDGNGAEVRRCTTINCPFWPYRMGRNPHNPKRGTNPFERIEQQGPRQTPTSRRR